MTDTNNGIYLEILLPRTFWVFIGTWLPMGRSSSIWLLIQQRILQLYGITVNGNVLFGQNTFQQLLATLHQHILRLQK